MRALITAVWRLYRLKRRLKPSDATRGKADPAKDGYYSKNNKEKREIFRGQLRRQKRDKKQRQQPVRRQP